MKKIFALVLCFCMLGTAVSAASLQFAIGSTEVKTVTEEKGLEAKVLETVPFTVDGRTLVPVRVIAENFGAQVGWDDATQTATVATDTMHIALTIGSNTAIVNGENIALDVAATEKNGRTLVPLRFIAETFGYNVKYIPSVEQIYITDSPIVFKGTHSFVTLEELMLQYKVAEKTYVPDAESGATAEEIMVGKLTLLESLFNFYATYCSVYDYALYSAPEGVPARVYEAYAAQAPSIEAQAQVRGELDVLWHAVYEMTFVADDYVETLAERITPEDIQKAYEDEYICAKHILIPTVNLQNGTALTEEEVAAAEALAKDLCKQIADGADFDALMQTYSKDGGLITNPDGYVFTKGEMVEEFYNGAAGLQVGEVSDPVLSVFGYHIIKRESLPAATQEFVSEYAQGKLMGDLQEIVTNYNFELVMELETLLELL